MIKYEIILRIKNYRFLSKHPYLLKPILFLENWYDYFEISRAMGLIVNQHLLDHVLVT